MSDLRAGDSAPDKLSGADQIVRESPPAAPVRALAKSELLPPGTRLSTGPGIRVGLTSRDGSVHLDVPPLSSVTLTAPGQASVDKGSVLVKLLRPLDFAFRVESLKKVVAIALGTEFSVRAEPACRQPGQPEGAPCVVVELHEGRLAIETRPPLRVGSDAPTATCRGAPGEEDDTATTLSVVEPLQAGQRRVVSLDPERFGLRFATWAEAEGHFRAELGRARDGGDPQAVLRALRNLGVVLRAGDRDAAALDAAQEGLALAQRLDDRRGQLRFTIDVGFAQWRARHDRDALPWFDRALSMTDVLQSASDADDIDLDQAALYARRGAIRFSARDRSQPGPDLTAAEADLRHALALREAAGPARSALDLPRSHYDLGVLLRIGRRDFAGAAAELRQALAQRVDAVGGCNDVLTAHILAELALAEEELGYAALATLAPPGHPGPHFDAAHQHFDQSLALLARLFPEGNNPGAARVARRAADFHRELAEVWAKQQQAAMAATERGLALQRYDQALAVVDSPAPPFQAERANALGGRGHARLDAGDLAGAQADLLAALRVWQGLRCQNSPEAPGKPTARTLLRLLVETANQANQADQANQTEAAAGWAGRLAADDPWEACPAAAAPASGTPQ